LKITDGFHLNCQTNSNNFGFNRISKWKKYRKKSVSLDLREGSLQMNRNITDTDVDILELFNYEMNAGGLFLTLGGKGSVYSNGKQVTRHPAYPSNIVDTIGAGDTFFSFACLLSSVEKEVVDLSIPSLAASLSTTWLCNERSVTKKSLTDYADRFLQ
jgi:fructose-1-phosphate kinase PfkB-like protein